MRCAFPKHKQVPVCSADELDAVCRRFNVGWGSIQSVVWHILRLQAQFINHLTIEILPVYHPSPEEKADAKLYAENVRRYS